MHYVSRSFRTGVLLMSLVIALGALGVVFALWSKTLTIEGTVETGNVDGVWFFASCAENPPSGEVEGKDVGQFTIAPDPLDQEVLIFTITNGYPSYLVDCEVHFANNGSIPIKIRGIVEDDPNGLAVTEALFDGVGSQLEPCGFTPSWGTNPLNVPADCQTAQSLLVHVEQSALQNAEYQFRFKVCIAQWNEPATAAECVAAAP